MCLPACLLVLCYLALLFFHQQPVAAIAVLLGGCKRVIRRQMRVLVLAVIKFDPKVVLGRLCAPLDVTHEPLVWAVLKGQHRQHLDTCGCLHAGYSTRRLQVWTQRISSCCLHSEGACNLHIDWPLRNRLAFEQRQLLGADGLILRSHLTGGEREHHDLWPCRGLLKRRLLKRRLRRRGLLCLWLRCRRHGLTLPWTCP